MSFIFPNNDYLNLLAPGSNVYFTVANGQLVINATVSGGTGSGTVTSVGLQDLTGLFNVTNTPISISGTLTLSGFNNQPAGTIFGNFGTSSQSPSFNSPGSSNQVLGVTTSGNGLEYKTISGTGGIVVLPSTGLISISATGLLPNVFQNLGDIVYSSGTQTATVLSANSTINRYFLISQGTGSATQAPFYGSITSGDLPSTTVLNSGSLSPLFTTNIAGQTLLYTLATANPGTLLGNTSSSNAQPSYVTLTGVGNVTVTPTSGNFQISTTATLTRSATAVINFGTSNLSDSNATVTISAPWVLSTTILVCSMLATPTADHDPDDYVVEGLSAQATNIIPGISFDVTVSAPNSTWGRYNINVIGL